MKLITLLMFMVVGHVAFAQTESIKFETKNVTVERSDDSLTIPIVVRADKSLTGRQATIDIDSGNTSKISLRETKKVINAKNRATFYIVIKKDSLATTKDHFTLKVSISGSSATATTNIIVTPGHLLSYTLNDYLNDDTLKLKYVTKVESTDNLLTVYGYHRANKDIIVKRKMMMNSDDIFMVSEQFKFYRPSLSLLTVPFKIRPAQDNLHSEANSGITNLGLNVDFGGWKWDRYYADASKKSHKVGIGLWLAPSVEELDSTSTKGFLTGEEKAKQVFLSTGLTISYSFNSISFVVVPVGFDLPTTKMGQEWVYKGRYWWGFGVAIEPKALAAILNK